MHVSLLGCSHSNLSGPLSTTAAETSAACFLAMQHSSRQHRQQQQLPEAEPLSGSRHPLRQRAEPAGAALRPHLHADQGARPRGHEPSVSYDICIATDEIFKGLAGPCSSPIILSDNAFQNREICVCHTIRVPQVEYGVSFYAI